MSDIASVLVTGGAGFIGGAVCRRLVRRGYRVVNLDKLTYAADLNALRGLDGEANYRFHQADICDGPKVASILADEQVHAIMHLAAETHVDRSIDGPDVFVQTNVVGTVALLNAALDYWRTLDGRRRDAFRFHHVSTDEVFGDLDLDEGVFTEETPYAPSSPYSASKAASDHFVRAWHETYGLPVVLSNCSNNYGPFHFPEKLIPLIILNALEGKELPVYGDGRNVRDWLYVDDHAAALELVLTKGELGQNYNIGGRAERSNIGVVETICDLLDAKVPLASGEARRSLIRFVTDRPGHDRRYAIDPTKAEQDLGWHAEESFETGLEKTVDWFLQNDWWWRPIREQRYSGARLGTGA
ncbi:dTDP-glucose 4,6-dehydratase [Sphingomonas hankyongi]|uniref:dTDP-glucose 4,6-dehydratase n=1 Tax=Sphingomonas hankyongi TaxID=2908209 RepID=A0ABT0S3L8_9SPHN|nr:dTDP-glucose 4,6-dehydratase [Sphingomonas hankyongi]MCL6730145.1 dTDP-glucose 4,6-dehydratase [Sphingomonas hankyongi]